MIKLLGCVLLVACGGGVGMYLIARDRRRMRMGEGMLDLIRFIHAQLESFCRPREALFACYENDFLSEVGFLALLRERGSIAIALKQCGQPTDEVVVTLMTQFDHELGRTYLNGQLAACDYYAARLETHLAALRATQASRARVWRTVTLAGAMLLALLLL